MPVAKLPIVISRNTEGSCQESDIVSTEILEKVRGDFDFTGGLCAALWNGLLNRRDEELCSGGITECLACPAGYLPELEVAFCMFEGIMYTTFGDALHTFDEGLQLIWLCVGNCADWRSVFIEWIGNSE